MKYYIAVLRTILACSTFFLHSLMGQTQAFLITGDANNVGHAHDSVAYDFSTNGRYALFLTGAANSGTSPGINQGGLYVRDLVTGTLSYVDGSSAAVAGEGAISHNGRFIAFRVAKERILWVDRYLNQQKVVNNSTSRFTNFPNGDCRGVQISDDGRYVAYATIATDLLSDSTQVPENGSPYVIVWDSATGESTVGTLSHDGQALDNGFGGVNAAEEFLLSPDGHYLFYSSDSSNAHPARASLQSQANFWLYRRDLQTGEVVIVSERSGGGTPSGNFTTPVVSADGRYVLFTGAFVGVSGDGNLVEGHSNAFGTDLFRKDMEAGEVILMTPTTDGAAANGFFGGHDISANGQRMAFASSATNFNGADSDGAEFDVFLAEVGGDGMLSISMVSQSDQTTENIGFHNGPFTTDDFVAFGTGEWDVIRGLPEASPYYHTVGVGLTPSIEIGTGATFEHIMPDSYFSGISISSDGQRWLLHDFNSGFLVQDASGNSENISGTESMQPLRTRTNSMLTMIASEGTYEGNYAFITWNATDGVTVLPEPPQWGQATVRIEGVLDSGEIVFWAQDFSTFETTVYLYTSEGGYESLDTSALGKVTSVESCLPSGWIFGLAENTETSEETMWRWSSSTGFETLGLPNGESQPTVHPLAFAASGERFLIREEAFPEDILHLWEAGSGYIAFSTETESPFFDSMSFDGGLFFYVNAGGAFVSGLDAPLLNLVDELVLFGVQPAQFSSGKFENLRSIWASDGSTNLFGNYRTADNRVNAFKAELPYTSIGSAPGNYPNLAKALGFLTSLGDHWMWHPVLKSLYVMDDSGWAFWVEMDTWVFCPLGQHPEQNGLGSFLYIQNTANLPGGAVTDGWIFVFDSGWSRVNP